MTPIADQIFGALPATYKAGLILAASGKTGTSSAGFPYIEERCFQAFLAHVPFLFDDGRALLEILDKAEADLRAFPESEEKADVSRSIKVLCTVIQTAAVTSPPDLWVTHYVWETHRQLGVIDYLTGKKANLAAIARDLKLSEAQLAVDFSLLRSRGYLQKDGDSFAFTSLPQTQDLIKHTPRTFNGPSDLVPCFRSVFSGKASDRDHHTAQSFLAGLPASQSYVGWPAGPYQLEIGLRVVPLVLALRSLGLTANLKTGANVREVLPAVTEEMLSVFLAAGYLGKNEEVTAYGARAFERGPGPFGIIHAYHTYMHHLSALVRGEKVQSWVARGENVAASQDANRKTFLMANDALDRFCANTGFRYQVFVEHAVGQGEATRQRFERSRNEPLAYFGADLEDAAIDKAVEAQKQGLLPANMHFIRHADIGQPQVVIEGIVKTGKNPQDAVMVVGNGFHEVRGQTNEKMIEVFRGYCDAGFLILFTEESGLSDEDLLQTAWNTYHAGFRYVHEISGQGLRPAIDKDNDEPGKRYSWRKCATLAGYVILEEYTTRTRKIFPHPRADGYNPAISVNYFCVPGALAERLGLKGS